MRHRPQDFGARRHRVLERDGWRCRVTKAAVPCGAPAVEVRRRSQYDSWNDRDLIAVCEAHEWSDEPVSNSRTARRKVARGRQDHTGRKGLPPPVPAEPQRLNAYKCNRCHSYTVTIDLHVGTTPATLRCRANGLQPHEQGACTGTARSAFYPRLPWPSNAPAPLPTWEWYTPSGTLAEQMRRRGGPEWEHVERGGLLLRRHGGTNDV